MEIHIDILKAVGEGRRKPTHIMYRANLTWARLKRHTDFLIGRSLLTTEETNGSTTFSLTTMGKEVLRYRKRLEYQVYRGKRAVPSKVYALAR